MPLRVSVAIHYRVVKIIDHFLPIPAQPETIEGIQAFLVEENAVEVSRLLEQPATRQRAGRHLRNFTVYAAGSQSIKVDSDSLLEARAIRVICHDKQLHSYTKSYLIASRFRLIMISSPFTLILREARSLKS